MIKFKGEVLSKCMSHCIIVLNKKSIHTSTYRLKLNEGGGSDEGCIINCFKTCTHFIFNNHVFY